MKKPMKYVKKPVVIEAMQFTGGNQKEIKEWTGEKAFTTGLSGDDDLIIPTLEGNMRAVPTDWIIEGIKGEFYPCKDEFYPCKDDIFRATYEQTFREGRA